MKYIKHICLFAICGLLLASCKDEPLPFETFEEMQHGAFARKLTDDAGSFFFTDPDNSNFSFSVEYYGDNNGGDIASHDWYVWHRNNTAGTVSDKVLLSSTPASSFTSDPTSGLPASAFSFTMNDALAALGLTIDDVNGGDDLIFDGILVMNNGAQFGPDNSGSALQGNNGFDGIFRFVKPLLCVSNLEGAYDFEATAEGGWGCTDMVSGTCRFAQIADGEYDIFVTVDGEEFRDFSFGTYRSCLGYASQDDQPNGDLRYVDACNQIALAGVDQWGVAYTLEDLQVNGSVLSISWSNGWDEAAKITVTRTDGSDWPDLRF